jgi:hypothetical protein
MRKSLLDAVHETTEQDKDSSGCSVICHLWLQMYSSLLVLVATAHRQTDKRTYGRTVARLI